MGIKCDILGHKWGEGEFKKYCKRKKCTAFKYLVENKYPKIGEPKYEWIIQEDINKYTFR
jgi:hypothetical protein